MRPDKVDIDVHKSHCLRNCIIVSVVMLVLLVAALFGGVFFAYDQFAKPIVGISLFEAWDIVGGLGKYKEEEIVTNPYTEEDRTAFYANLENATCIDLPADFTISKAVNELLKSKTPEGGSPEEVPAPMMPLAGEEVAPDAGGTSNPLEGLNSFSTGSDYLDSVLKETGFDFSSLKDFEDGAKDLVITDKQFAAVMNEVITGLDMQEIKDIEAQLGVAIKDLVSLKQVTISGVPTIEAMLNAGEDKVFVPLADENAPIVDPLRKDIQFSLVLCLNLGDNVKPILSNMVQGIPDFASNLVAGILPKKIFVTAGVYPYDGTKRPILAVNGIKDKIMDNLLTAVNGILQYQNSPDTVDTYLGKVTGLVTDTISTMEDMVGELRFVDSAVALDPITMLMTVLGVNAKDADPSTYVTGNQFFTMLKHIYHTDNSLGDVDIDAYIDTMVGADNRISEAEYKAVLGRISTAYGIEKTVDFDMSTWLPTDFMAKYSEIPAHINIVNYETGGKHLYEMKQEELEPLTTFSDNAIGYMLNDIIKEQLKNGIEGIPFDLGVESFELYEPTDKPGELRLRFTAGVDTASILTKINKDAVLYKLFSSLIPAHLYMELELPMSIHAGPAGLILNFIGDGEDGHVKTAEAFSVVQRIVTVMDPALGEMMDVDALLAKIKGLVDDMLAELNNALSNLAPQNPAPAAMSEEHENLAPIVIKKGGIQLPTIYDILRAVAGDATIKQNDIQEALLGMYKYDTIAEQNDAVVDDFIASELEGKLFLINNIDPATGKKEYTKETVFAKMQGLQDEVVNKGISKVIDGRALIEDTTMTTVDELNLMLGTEVLSAIINTSGLVDKTIEGMPYTNIKATEGARIFKDAEGAFYMTLIIKGALDPLALGDAPMGIKYENLLPGEMYIKATVKLTNDANNFTTVIDINKVTTASKNTIDKLLASLIKGEAGGMSFATIEQMVGEQVSTALQSFTTSAGADAISYDDAGNGSIVALNIYDVIYDYLIKDNLSEADRADIDAQTVMDIFKQTLADRTPVVTPEVPLNRLITEELQAKMLLSDTVIPEGTTNIIDVIKNIANDSDASNNIFDKIDTTRINNFATADEMNIKIYEDEMFEMMRDEMEKNKLAGFPAIFSEPTFDAMNIVDNGIVKMYMSSNIDKTMESPEFKQILPFMPDHVVLEVTMDLTTAEISTSLLMNNLTNENFDKASKIISAITVSNGAAAMDLNEITTQVNKYMKDMLDGLQKIGLPLSFNKGVDKGNVSTGNIYDVLKTTDVRFDTLSDNDIHSIMRQLFLPVEEQEKIVFNPKPLDDTQIPTMPEYNIAKTPMPSDPTIDVNIKVSDSYIAYGLFTGNIKNGSEGAIDGSIKQMAILTGDGLANIKAKPQYSDIFAPTTKNAILVSISVDPDSYIDASVDKGLAKNLPSKFMMTGVMEISGNTSDSVVVTPLINNMTKTDMANLELIMGGDSQNNIMSKVSSLIRDKVLGVKILKQGDVIASLGSGIDIKADKDITLGDILINENNIYEHVGDKTRGIYGKLGLDISIPNPIYVP